jgi:hypothetical protein
MLPLLETALAFAVAMLAASLFVSAVVQILQRLGRYRARAVSDMLASLLHGFRVYFNDADVLTGEKDRAASMTCAKQEVQFATDILADPILHSRAMQETYSTDLDELAKHVDYVSADDVISLERNYAAYYRDQEAKRQNALPEGTPRPGIHEPPPGEANHWLPPEWVGGSYAEPKNYATTAAFAEYIKSWFKTVEGTATDQYRARVRQLVILVSAIVVVLFNLDGLHLLQTLYTHSGARQSLVAQADTLQRTAERLGVAPALAAKGPADSSTPAETAGAKTDVQYAELVLEMQKTATILDDANAGIGWQQSWITQRWLAHAENPKKADLGLLLDTLVWLLGIAFSWVMLSLGAPFWYGILSKFLNWKSALDPGSSPPSNASSGPSAPSNSSPGEPAPTLPAKG